MITLNQIIELLTSFADRCISVDDFVASYMSLWKQLRDDEYRVEQKNPLLRRARDVLIRLVRLKALTPAQSLSTLKIVGRCYMSVPINPYGEASDIFNQVFTAADCYAPPEETIIGQIDEEALRRIVSRAVARLIELNAQKSR